MILPKKALLVRLAVILGFFVPSIFAYGQTRSITVTVDDPRPLAKAALEIQKLSGIPVSYEDVRTESSADTKDVTDAVQTPAQKAANPTSRIIVPRGGQLSTSILVDAASGRLLDAADVNHALDALLVAYRSTNLPGDFTLESYNGVYFLAPNRTRNAVGNTAPATPVLSTPVTLPQETRVAYQSLQLILDQVSRVSGFRVGIGQVPLNGLAMSKVTIGASNEPANHVIARLLEGVSAIGHAEATPIRAMSYLLFFDPKLKIYALNIDVVPKLDVPAAEMPPPAGSGGPRFPREKATSH